MDHSFQCVRLARKCAEMNMRDRGIAVDAPILVNEEANSYLETMPFVCICPAIVTVTVQTPYGTDTMTVKLARPDALVVLDCAENYHERNCDEFAESGDCSHVKQSVTGLSATDFWSR